MKKILLSIIMLSILLFSSFASGAAPTVTTGSATVLTIRKTQLSGTLTNDGGEACTVWFEYGTTLSYGNKTDNQTKVTGNVFSFREGNATSRLRSATIIEAS